MTKSWDCGGCSGSPVNGFPYCPGQEECAFLKQQGLNKVKRLPCQYCDARGGKRHAPTCNRPVKVTDLVATRPQRGVLRNRIALVIDSSGSMCGFRNDVVRIVNEQVAEIKKNAAKLGQQTSLTIYTFADLVYQKDHYEDVFTFKGLERYLPSGNTAMFDAIGKAINDLRKMPFGDDLNTSFLIVTFTDGEENRSLHYNKDRLLTAMREVERTDRWTFAFSVPRGGRRQIVSFGIPDGNIQEWEQTAQGIQSMNQSTMIGINTYYGARSNGATRSMSFFQPDLTAIPKTAIRNLNDLSQSFQVWNVDCNVPIREFVEDKIRQQPAIARKVGSNYQVGRAYYQLTKSEEVQATKDLVILDKATNALYGGNEARELIGCPMNQTFKLKPGNLGNYEVFVKSTSVNRKLLSGTKMLYFLK